MTIGVVTMTREECVFLMEALQNEPFHILINQHATPLLEFVKMSETAMIVKILSSGKPAIYKYEAIDAIEPGSIESPITSIDKEKTIDKSADTAHTKITFDNHDNWGKILLEAKQAIQLIQLKPINRREEIKANVKGTEIAKEWARIDSKFQDALKNHSLEHKKDGIIAELNELYDIYECYEVKMQLGMVFAALKDYDNASREFGNGGDYYNAACYSMYNKKDELVLINLKNLCANQMPNSEDVFSTLFYLLLKNKKGALGVDIIKNIKLDKLSEKCIDMIFYGLLLLSDLYMQSFTLPFIPSTSHVSAIPLLLDILGNLTSKEEIEYVSLGKKKSIRDITSSTATEEKKLSITDTPKEYTGRITRFEINDNNAYGFIKSPVESSLYFNIRQVEDDLLRNILYTHSTNQIDVVFTLGKGTRGKSADHIRPNQKIDELNTVYKGFVASYGNYDINGNRYGTVICNKNTFLFRDEAVIDPILTAYFEQTFNTKEVSVCFLGKKINKNRIVTKMWLDDEETIIMEDYSKFVDKRKYNKYLDEKYKIVNLRADGCPFCYTPLEAWDEESIKKAVDTAAELVKPVHNTKGLSIYGINELLRMGQTYLTVHKNLPKAETCYKTVLERNPGDSHVKTAVGSLIQIYMRTERIEDALKILQDHKNKLGKETYNNSLIQILDKAKQYEDLAELLKKIIPVEKKSNTKADRIRKLIQCYIKLKKGDMALKKLNKYKNGLDEFSYNNLYISCLEVMSDFENLEKHLEDLISHTYRIEYKLNYINKLALLSQKNSELNKAIYWLDQWKKTLYANRTHIGGTASAATIAKMESSVDRNLSVLYYITDDKSKAKEYAKDLLKKNSEDKVAQQILDDTYINDTRYQQQTLDSGEDYVDFESSGDSLPKFIEWMMNNVNYNDQFYKKAILKNIKDDKYIGDSEQAKSDIQSFSGAIGSRNPFDQSSAWLALAKIVQQFVEKGIEDEELSLKRRNVYIGRSLSLLGDSNIQKMDQNLDSSRYYYFLAIRYLNKNNDRKRYYSTFNMLYCTFFLSENELSKLTKNSGISNELQINPPKYTDSIVSVRDFIICTFDLYKAYSNKLSETIRRVLNAIYNDQQLRLKCVDYFNIILNENNSIDNHDNFYTIWKKAREIYNSIIEEELIKAIISATDETYISERLRTYTNQLKEIRSKGILSNTDKVCLDDIIDILEKFDNLNELKMIDDRTDKLESIIDSCVHLISKIQNTPTKLSYESWLDPIMKLYGTATERLNNLYKDSKPKLMVSSCDVAYYKDNQYQTTITIYVKNNGNVQRADISNIHICGHDNMVEIIGNPEHSISTVKGNDKDEYIVNVQFTEKEKQRKSFDIEFSFDYNYYKSDNETARAHFEEIFQITLSTIENFKKIDNRFDRYCEGAAVCDDDMFFGREKEIEEIVNMLDLGKGQVLSHRGIYMYGQKRAGKSSIMAHLKNRISERYPGKYLIVDIGSIGNTPENSSYETTIKSNLILKLSKLLQRESNELYEKINDRINFRDARIRLENNPDSNIFEEVLEEVEGVLNNRTIMVFVDEFTYIYERIKKGMGNSTFPHFWKALLQNHNICSIVIGQDNMIHFVNDINYQNDFACMKPYPVSYLNEEGAKSLINDPIKEDSQSRFEDEALDLIYELTAGSAYLIMIFCKHLVDYMNLRGTLRVTKITIETFIKKYLFDVSVNSGALTDFHFEAQLHDPCFFEDEKKIAEDNKTILTYIAENCNQNNQIKIKDIDCIDMLSEKNKTHQDKLIDQLIKRKVLIKDGEYCKIWVDLLRRYLRKDSV